MQIENGWIGTDIEYLNIWNLTREQIYMHLEAYEIDKAIALLYKFFWNEFCDIWIEKSKQTPTSTTLKIIIKDIREIFEIFI